MYKKDQIQPKSVSITNCKGKQSSTIDKKKALFQGERMEDHRETISQITPLALCHGIFSHQYISLMQQFPAALHPERGLTFAGDAGRGGFLIWPIRRD